MPTPFGSDGRSTLEDFDVKALVLQLDPDDDEAEWEARMETERRATNDIENALESQQARVMGRIRIQPTNTDLEIEGTDGDVQIALRRALAQSADLGVQIAVRQFENVGLSFDWTLANAAAREWANSYAGELIGGINETTQRRVQASIVEWVDSGAPLDDLIADIATIFGRDRAELIASTEVTRAYAQGNVQAHIASGLVSGAPEKRPPDSTHPRCRCWLVLREDNGKWSYEWRTANDERVCPICGPLHGQEIRIA